VDPQPRGVDEQVDLGPRLRDLAKNPLRSDGIGKIGLEGNRGDAEAPRQLPGELL
jgi:hypothetical protein